jgi:hypothetical protein
MITIKEFKTKYNLKSQPGIECFHRLRSGNKPKHKSRTARFSRTGGCHPPHNEHTFGFRTREGLQPVLCTMPYYQNEDELNKIKKDCTEYAERNRVNVCFSVEETWWHQDTVLVVYTPKKFIHWKPAATSKSAQRKSREFLARMRDREN